MAETYNKEFAELYWHNKKAIIENQFMDAVDGIFDSIDALAINQFRKITMSDDYCEVGRTFKMLVDNQVSIMANEAAHEGTRL